MGQHAQAASIALHASPLPAAPALRRNRVKFWFIKNYMSPQMKRFVPHMARQYGFEYEFVTYRWPSWLHQQARSSCSCCCSVLQCSA